jgi:hypothetical protein
MSADWPLSGITDIPYVRILQICREEDGASVYANVCRTDNLSLALA